MAVISINQKLLATFLEGLSKERIAPLIAFYSTTAEVLCVTDYPRKLQLVLWAVRQSDARENDQLCDRFHPVKGSLDRSVAEHLTQEAYCELR